MSKTYSIPEEVKQVLETLERETYKKIYDERKALEVKLTIELTQKLKAFANEHQIGFSDFIYEGDTEEMFDAFDNKERLLIHLEKYVGDLAKMFVNNSITESSISDDPSGDWDGYNRGDDFHENCFPLKEIDSFFP